MGHSKQSTATIVMMRAAWDQKKRRFSLPFAGSPLGVVEAFLAVLFVCCLLFLFVFFAFFCLF